MKAENYSEFQNLTDFYLIQLLDNARKLNILFTTLFIFIGLIGNFLTIYIFSHKKNRNNSSNIFLLCLALNDSLYLVIHFFENTLTNLQQIYHEDKFLYNLIQTVNLSDKFVFSCIIFSYFRYVLRFISAYIIVAFTIQRFLIVSLPLNDTFKSKKFAWKIILIILIISIIINLWIPLIFDLQTDSYNNSTFCEIHKEKMKIYLLLASIYVILILIIPLIIIFTSNLLIIIKTRRSGLKRTKNNLTKIKFSTLKFKSNKFQVRRRNALAKNRFSFHFKPLYLNKEQMKQRRTILNSNRTAKFLILISLSYILLNCPYIIAWYLFYIEFSPLIERNDSTLQMYLITAVKITEIFFILNYGLHFYFYCFAGKRFFNSNFKSITTVKVLRRTVASTPKILLNLKN
jgi:hypothetical protein